MRLVNNHFSLLLIILVLFLGQKSTQTTLESTAAFVFCVLCSWPPGKEVSEQTKRAEEKASSIRAAALVAAAGWQSVRQSVLLVSFLPHLVYHQAVFSQVFLSVFPVTQIQDPPPPNLFRVQPSPSPMFTPLHFRAVFVLLALTLLHFLHISIVFKT
ncbi:hypothetical protein L596_000434 [Steinernema carpocapsae]|uniref:Secreted protein n=1 Tax=Steinernema carpocapsae TaxID=34508 RepID=A0A4U8UKH8_STECR|nr:hypothetical protein L596_000434 [Steinernema carpocapsae]